MKNLDQKFLDKVLKIKDRLKGVTADHRQVQPGYAFVAIQGSQTDGHTFLTQALSAGAEFLVGEKSPDLFSGPIQKKYIQVDSSRQALAWISDVFYNHPTKNFLLIGVTGTSGKTTTAYLIEAILKNAGYKTGLIGTVECRFNDKSYPSAHTTPDALSLQALFSEWLLEGVQAVVMEVSSHALEQNRVDFLRFDGVVFTNLTPEHLDFHSTMEEYFKSKTKLFSDCLDFSISENKRPFAVINQYSTPEWSRRLVIEYLQPRKVKTIEVGKDLILLSQQMSDRGIKAQVKSLVHQKTIELESTLLGSYNLENLICALGVGLEVSVDHENVLSALRSVKNIPGRLEPVLPQEEGHPFVWVDYAHKPDALKKVLITLEQIKPKNKRIITVFGCGGDRDREKRPLMGRIACEHSNWVIVTSDNPRTEDPQKIIGEIRSGMGSFSNWEIEPDRALAIKKAILEAFSGGDMVIIAGKGHEPYQILGDKKISFDDREVASKVLTSLSKNK